MTPTRHSNMGLCDMIMLICGASVWFGQSKAAQPSSGVLLTADPPWSDVFPGDTVTLTCQVTESEGWVFIWTRYRQGRIELLSGSSGVGGSVYVLSSVTEEHSGRYQCEGKRGKERAFSSHNITVSDTRPPAVVVADPPDSVMFTGETVTLSCDIRKGSGWRYSWARNIQGRLKILSASSSETQQNYTLHSVTESDTGAYSCQGERGQNHKILSHSGSVQLKVSALPQAELTVQSGGAEVFPTERVTLRCEIQGSSTEWMYRWYRDGQELPVDKADSSSGNGDTYTILSADQSHTGLYTCRGELTERGVQSTISSAVKLNVTIYRGVENLVRICVGVAVLIVLSVIVNEAFWRRVSQIRRSCTDTGTESDRTKTT
ncbi:hypothetical protein AGOR_G00139960 [Albula goreensis]|uniref:Ig-like domain-containing protein n=1 Tax=Albula goreensis TaxID=1534307 RepID=A0A8T3DBW0_9TELE|nr:hypothetical protein AGOR_G00139960 [Albula goreensis]